MPVQESYYLPGFELYDFRLVSTVKLVLCLPDTIDLDARSIGDYLPDDLARSNGHVMLSHALRSLGLAADEDETLELEIQTSTLFHRFVHGVGWIHPFWRSCRGLPLELSLAPATWSVPDELRIIFPSAALVRTSRGGPDAAHTLFCPGNGDWQRKENRRNLYEGLSRRRGVLAHTKVRAKSRAIKLTSQQVLGLITPPGGSYPRAGWLYTGSANFAPGAWVRRRLLDLALIDQGKLNVRDQKYEVKAWELGVVRLSWRSAR